MLYTSYAIARGRKGEGVSNFPLTQIIPMIKINSAVSIALLRLAVDLNDLVELRDEEHGRCYTYTATMAVRAMGIEYIELER